MEYQSLNNGEQLSTNQRDVLDAVRRMQPVKRSMLTDEIDLTQQSVHRLIVALEEKGLIETQRGVAAGRGKPSPVLELNRHARAGLGILVNTDSAVLSVAGLDCKPLQVKRLTIDVADRKQALKAILENATILLEENDLSWQKVCGIGFTLPGFFTQKWSAFNAPELLQDWSLIDLKTELEEQFDKPVFLENSANAGAIGETLENIGHTYKNFVYLAFDYGFGGAVVLDGQLLHGRAGNAGELSTIYQDGELERRPALAPLIRRLADNNIELSGVEDLRQNFDPNWLGVEEWINDVLPQLNRLIFALTGIIDPEAIVFGGQIAPELASILIERVEFPRTFRYGAPPPLPDLVMGSVSGDPAASGVAQLPIKHFYFR